MPNKFELLSSLMKVREMSIVRRNTKKLEHLIKRQVGSFLWDKEKELGLSIMDLHSLEPLNFWGKKFGHFFV